MIYRCRTGDILKFDLKPEYETQRMSCHVQPKPGSVLYRLQYQVLYDGLPVKNKTFTAERVVAASKPGGVRAGLNRSMLNHYSHYRFKP